MLCTKWWERRFVKGTLVGRDENKTVKCGKIFFANRIFVVRQVLIPNQGEKKDVFMTLNFCLCVFEQKAKAKPTVTISNEYGSSFEKEQQPSNYRGTNFTPRLTQLTQWSIWLKIKGRKMHFNFTILFSFVQYFFVLNPGGMLLLFFTGVYGLWCSSRVEPNRKINKFK